MIEERTVKVKPYLTEKDLGIQEATLSLLKNREFVVRTGDDKRHWYTVHGPSYVFLDHQLIDCGDRHVHVEDSAIDRAAQIFRDAMR